MLAILGGEPAVPASMKPLPWPPVSEPLEIWMTAALRSNRLNYGENSLARDLEEEFAAWQRQEYTIATCSGSVALWAAYYSIMEGKTEIPKPPLPGKEAPEVIIGGYGFWATATAALYAGLRPIFCDVETDTGNISSAAAEEAITPRTRAIAVTHIHGHPADIPALLALAAKHNLFLVEDCSHAHGATLHGQKVGTFGMAAAFSLQTLKTLSAGEGGLLSTDNPVVFERAAALVNVRRLDTVGELHPTGLGLKLRISPLSAALASFNLRRLNTFISERRKKLNYLTKCLLDIGGVLPPTTRSGADRGAWYEYAVRYPDELDEVCPKPTFLEALAAEGIHLPPSNTRAFYRYPPFSWIYANLPVADRLERETFFLPPFTFEGKDMIEAYAAAVGKVLKELPALALAEM